MKKASNETAEETEFYDHVAHCKRCKITGPKGKEEIRHCAKGELLQFKAAIFRIGTATGRAEL